MPKSLSTSGTWPVGVSLEDIAVYLVAQQGGELKVQLADVNHAWTTELDFDPETREITVRVR